MKSPTLPTQVICGKIGVKSRLWSILTPLLFLSLSQVWPWCCCCLWPLQGHLLCSARGQGWENNEDARRTLTHPHAHTARHRGTLHTQPHGHTHTHLHLRTRPRRPLACLQPGLCFPPPRGADTRLQWQRQKQQRSGRRRGDSLPEMTSVTVSAGAHDQQVAASSRPSRDARGRRKVS